MRASHRPLKLRQDDARRQVRVGEHGDPSLRPTRSPILLGPMATIKLNRQQRDAIYGELVLDLSGTGDIRISLDGGDYEAAKQPRQRFEEDMRLLDDLGWEPEQDRDEFEVTMDYDDVARVLHRVNRSAGDTLHIYVVEPMEGDFASCCPLGCPLPDFGPPAQSPRTPKAALEAAFLRIAGAGSERNSPTLQPSGYRVAESRDLA